MYHLGQTSESKLENIDPLLVKCVRRAITNSSVDFGVYEGLRTRERQAELYKQGVSRTLDSYHLTGHAVDLVPWIGGRLQWQMTACVQVAIAMREAAEHFDVRLTWGGVWDRMLVGLDQRNMAREIDWYIGRYRAAHGPDAHPLIDGPHFQVAR